VLQEAQFAAGLEHPSQLAQGAWLILDGAQHEAGDGGVEARGIERERLGHPSSTLTRIGAASAAACALARR
jgi:hypothetical protein